MSKFYEVLDRRQQEARDERMEAMLNARPLPVEYQGCSAHPPVSEPELSAKEKIWFICGAWTIREEGPILNFEQPFKRAQYVFRCDLPDGHEGQHVDSVLLTNWEGPSPQEIGLAASKLPATPTAKLKPGTCQAIECFHFADVCDHSYEGCAEPLPATQSAEDSKPDETEAFKKWWNGAMVKDVWKQYTFRDIAEMAWNARAALELMDAEARAK